MKSQEFEEIIKGKLDATLEVLLSKNGAYNPDDDKLAGFKKSAAMRGVSWRSALAGMMLKHTTSVYDMTADGAGDFPQDVWEEKIGDHINYLLLLLCIVWEEKTEHMELSELRFDPQGNPLTAWQRRMLKEFSDDDLHHNDVVTYATSDVIATQKLYEQTRPQFPGLPPMVEGQVDWFLEGINGHSGKTILRAFETVLTLGTYLEAEELEIVEPGKDLDIETMYYVIADNAIYRKGTK